MHPLTKEDLDNINTSLKAIKSTREIILRGKAAGIDLATQEAELNVNESRLNAIKAGFFPSGRA